MSDNDSLVELHTALIDTGNGYEEAIKDAQKPDLVALFERAKSLHEKAHASIHAILSARGVTPDDKGSFMSTVHETIISVRSAVVGLDKGSLSSFSSGEQMMIEAYDKAIQSNSDDGPVRMALEQQRSTLFDLIGEMQRKAA
jgi:uncharacterized protein (TIGR02284 family)